MTIPGAYFRFRAWKLRVYAPMPMYACCTRKRGCLLEGLSKKWTIKCFIIIFESLDYLKISKIFFLPEVCDINKVFVKKVCLFAVYIIQYKFTFTFISTIADVAILMHFYHLTTSKFSSTSKTLWPNSRICHAFFQLSFSVA